MWNDQTCLRNASASPGEPVASGQQRGRVGDDCVWLRVNGEGELQKGREGALQKWMDTPGLQILNIMYDVTPAEYVNMVVTEMGNLPASSVPVVHRASTNA